MSDVTAVTIRMALEHLASAIRSRASELETGLGRIAPYAAHPMTLRGWADEIESSDDGAAVYVYRRVASDLASSGVDGSWGHVAEMTLSGNRYVIDGGAIYSCLEAAARRTGRVRGELLT